MTVAKKIDKNKSDGFTLKDLLSEQDIAKLNSIGKKRKPRK